MASCRHGARDQYCPHCDGWPSDREAPMRTALAVIENVKVAAAKNVTPRQLTASELSDIARNPDPRD